jgi:ubiquinone/menaquinone biosynthesis C-methylase UbiE
VLARSVASVLGVDASVEMIEGARKRLPEPLKEKISYQVIDGHGLRGAVDRGGFDAVFSNAALHWMKKPEEVVEGVRFALKLGGRFAAEVTLESCSCPLFDADSVAAQSLAASPT